MLDKASYQLLEACLTFALLGAGEPSLGIGLREKLLPLPFGDLDLDLDRSSGV